jgi:hypothetical protein
MKTSIKIAAAALLVAGSVTSAFAQAYEGGPEGRPVHSFARPAPHIVVAPQARRLTPQARRSYGAIVTPSNPTAVYANGKLIGQDPDPNVRMMLQKDFTYQ